GSVRPLQAGKDKTDKTSGKNIYQQALRSTVWVVVPLGGGRASTGSGSLIDMGGHILTNYHVVAKQTDALIFFPLHDDKGKLIVERDKYKSAMQTALPGKVLASDAKRDLAIIKLQQPIPANAKPLHLAAQGVDPGEDLHSIGNPAISDALWVYNKGQVKQVYTKKFMTTNKKGEEGFEVNARIVETTSPVNSGDSGGPVLNDKGELVAVVQGHIPDAQA